MSQQPPILTHPLRLVAGGSVGVATVIVAGVPFVREIEPATLIVPALAYGFLLNFFSVGLVLTVPSRLMGWWLVAGVVPLLNLAAFDLLIRPAPVAILGLSSAQYWALFAELWLWLAAGCALAGWGWVRYLRWRWPAGRT
jgi:hypothetical protein